MLTSRGINTLRNFVDKFLKDTVVIKRQSALESDGAGGQKPTSGDGWATFARERGLLTSPNRRPRERAIANQITAPVEHDVLVLHPTVATNQDRLLIDSRTFEVQGVAKNAEWGILDRITCVERQIG